MARRVSHYVEADVEGGAKGLVCDACWGRHEDFAEDEAFVIERVPYWMKSCPVCGLKITRVDGPWEGHESE